MGWTRWGLVMAMMAGLPAAAETAQGQLTVKLAPMPAGADGMARHGLDKIWSGDLVATSQGEMLSAGDPGKGVAGYVALEVVRGTLAGRSGGFALQHSGQMDAAGQRLGIAIVPGSGTGALAGITGTLAIRIEGGVHHYTLDYALPAQP
jgi:hypothetical protein